MSVSDSGTVVVRSPKAQILTPLNLHPVVLESIINYLIFHSVFNR